MKPDPTIDAIRKVRHQISASVDHDPRKLVEHYQQLQERHRDRIVSHNVDEIALPELHETRPGLLDSFSK